MSLKHSRRHGARLAGLAGVGIGAVVVALSLALSSAPALAASHDASRALHARYVSSDPAANAVVKTAPTVVIVHFAEPVDPAGSAVAVYDAKGQVVSQPAQVDPNDLKTMRAPMQGNGSEVYLVSWHTVSAVDGDPDVGAFSFFVNASGTSELAPATTTPTQTTTPASASGVPVWLAVVIGLGGLLVGAAGAIAWRRSRVGASASGSAGAR